jgi:hypothetical protein
MKAIQLTKEQADSLRGYYDLYSYLDPQQISDDLYYISEIILSDNAYKSIWSILAECPLLELQNE